VSATQPESTHGVVRTSVDVAATPERVFAALTDPRELARWWGSDDTHRAREWVIDARPGGRWRADTCDAAGNAGWVQGTFLAVEPARLLETTWMASWDDAPSRVRWELEPHEVDGAPGTRVTVTHEGPTGATVMSAARGMKARFAAYGPWKEGASRWRERETVDVWTPAPQAVHVPEGNRPGLRIWW